MARLLSAPERLFFHLYSSQKKKKLTASEDRETFSHDLKTSTIPSVMLRDVKVSDHDVGGHGCSCFSANLCQHTFRLRTLSCPDNPPLMRTLHCGGQENQSDGHIDLRFFFFLKKKRNRGGDDLDAQSCLPDDLLHHRLRVIAGGYGHGS